jgi:hypothetical protein
MVMNHAAIHVELIEKRAGDDCASQSKTVAVKVNALASYA